MYVPNYVPEPLEVPGNVTLSPYAVRISFIRQVTLLHLIGLGLLAAMAFVPVPKTGCILPVAVLCAILILLDLLRIKLRSRPLEARISSACLPCVLLVVAWLAQELALTGLPVGFVLAGPVCCGIYTVACGRDYSFVGCFLLSLIASSTVLAALANQLRMPSNLTAYGLALNAVYLTYFVYDLASLMARRRRGEESAAVVDLYRDIFNFFGYLVRIVGHWKRHKIWAPPH